VIPALTTLPPLLRLPVKLEAWSLSLVILLPLALCFIIHRRVAKLERDLERHVTRLRADVTPLLDDHATRILKDSRVIPDK
jgi:hypothetical protein